MQDILTLIWLFLPVAFANMAPVIANNIPQLKKYTQPLDFNKAFRGKRIFGDHKSVRGLVAGVAMGGLIGGLQILVTNEVNWFNSYFMSVDYSSPMIIIMGMGMGFGAVAGDAIKSFFKRQAGIEPGKSWVPFDQIDFVIGGLIASTPFFSLSSKQYFLGIGIALVLHPTFNVLAWLARMQENPY